MKNIIKKLLREGLDNTLFEERYNINTIPDIVLLNALEYGNNIFLLYNIKIKKPIGYISFTYNSGIDVYSVGGVYAKSGYGPLLYEIAMTYVYPNGLTLSQDGSTSQEAQNVWEKFVSRNDVKKEKIVRITTSEKEKDLINGCDDDDFECLEWLNKIINLHNTKFIYNLGKEELAKMIKLGKQYCIDNTITNDDIEHMAWDLE